MCFRETLPTSPLPLLECSSSDPFDFSDAVHQTRLGNLDLYWVTTRRGFSPQSCRGFKKGEATRAQPSRGCARMPTASRSALD